MGNLENNPNSLSPQDRFVAAYYQFVRTVENKVHTLEEDLFRAEAAYDRGDPQVSPAELRRQQVLFTSENARISPLRALRSGLTYRPNPDGFSILSTVAGTEVGVDVQQKGSDEFSIGYLVKGEKVGLEEAGEVAPYLSAMRDLATDPRIAHLPKK